MTGPQRQAFPAPAPTPAPVDAGTVMWVWDQMDAEERISRLIELGRWTEWLVSTYNLGNTLDECWHEHPDVVEVLTALYLQWIQAYTPPPDGRPPNHAEKTHWISSLNALRSQIHTPNCGQGHVKPQRPPWRTSQVVMRIVVENRDPDPVHEGHPALLEMLRWQRQGRGG